MPKQLSALKQVRHQIHMRLRLECPVQTQNERAVQGLEHRALRLDVRERVGLRGGGGRRFGEDFHGVEGARGAMAHAVDAREGAVPD